MTDLTSRSDIECDGLAADFECSLCKDSLDENQVTERAALWRISVATLKTRVELGTENLFCQYCDALVDEE